MDISEKMRLIEKLHAERDEARARAAEFEKAREEDRRALDKERRAREEEQRALDKERRAREETLERFRDTARNILRLGLPVDQVAQATGLPPETVGELAAQL